jgi:hypothetical protein
MAMTSTEGGVVVKIGGFNEKYDGMTMEDNEEDA